MEHLSSRNRHVDWCQPYVRGCRPHMAPRQFIPPTSGRPMTWDSATVKAHLRSTIQLLGQLQAKKDANAQIIRKDIATLLGKGNITLARYKAHNLVQDDTLADLLEVLEQQVGTLLDRFTELEKLSSPSSALVQASSSIIFAASRLQLRELNVVSDMIADRLGEEVATSARDNRYGHVSPVVLQATSRQAPSSYHLDAILERIADSHGVQWVPGPRRHDLANQLSEAFNPATGPPYNIPQLRDLCCKGIPDEPTWLRPRIWKLLMSATPTDKVAWQRENAKQRDTYYDLIKRLLEPFTHLPPPSTPISGLDEKLLEVYKHLVQVPAGLLNQLDSEPEDSSLCPFHQNSPENIRISFSHCLDTRLQCLLRLDKTDRREIFEPITSEANAGNDLDSTPTISLTEPNALYDENNVPKTLLSSRAISLGGISQRHASALLRLLYVHGSLNSGNLSPYVSSLLVPLYTALTQEIEQDDLAHAEADSFWLFEAFIAEFVELEDEKGLNSWILRFGELLERRDPELSEQLNAVGLHPASSHFSQRWLSSMLTHTLPLSAVYPVWDIILSCPGRERGRHPRLDSLVEICTAMVIAAKPLIFEKEKTQGLWGQKSFNHWTQPDEGFLQGLAILQSYPIDPLGGIDTILQLSADLTDSRLSISVNGAEKGDQAGFGARIRETLWKGFTNQVDSLEGSDDEGSDDEDGSSSEEEDENDGNETETPGHDLQPSSLTSRIATSVWRGITNQSAMEASSPPSPAAPRQETPGKPPGLLRDLNTSSTHVNLWTYTDKLKDSDTMAALAKLSTNWRAKAMLSPWSRPKESTSAPVSFVPLPLPLPPSEAQSTMTSTAQKLRRKSLPIYDHNGALYSPPPRPSFFRNPRDSLVSSATMPMLCPAPEMAQHDESPSSDKSAGLLEKTRNSLHSSLQSFTRTPSPMPSPTLPQSAPRPLMLNSACLITSHNSGRSRIMPTEDRTATAKLGKVHRDSTSSVSSLSPDALYRKSSRSDHDSDTSASRIVPLNRKSVSPMAPKSRLYRSRPPFIASTTSSDQAVPETPAKDDKIDCQSTISLVSPEEEIPPDGKAEVPMLPKQALLTRRTYRRKPDYPSGDASDSSAGDITLQTARSRSRRHTPRLSDLKIEKTASFEEVKSLESPSNLVIVAWPNEDLDVTTTPKPGSFDLSDSPVRLREERSRKISNNARPRKVSNSNRENVRRSRAESGGEDGDDEGYDDLLSAYESEESISFTR